MQNEKYILKMKEIVGDEIGTINYSIYTTIIKNERKIVDLTLLEFSKMCNTSKPSIIKFLNKAGLSGFSELKFLIMNHIDTKEVKHTELVISKEFNSLSSFQKKYFEVLREYDFLLEKNLNENMSSILELTEKISSAKTTYIFAQNLGYFASHNFKQQMRLSNKNIILENDLNIIERYVSQIEKNSVVIIVSLSGMNPLILNISEKLKSKEIYSFGIVGIESSISKNLTNHFLVPQVEENLWDSYSIRSIYLIQFLDILYFQLLDK